MNIFKSIDLHNFLGSDKMQEVDFIWINGKMVPWKEANTHVLAHTLHYGTGVFEGIRAYETSKGAAIFRLQEHIKRLFNSAEIIGIEIPYTIEEVIEATKKVVKENKLDSCYIRPLIYFGYGKMGLDSVGAKVDSLIAAWPWGAYLGEEGKANGITAKISNYTRHFAVPNLNHAKATGFYVNSMIAKMDALNTGVNEAIMLDLQGNVAEGTGENIFIIKDGILKTPKIDNCLEGITRASVIEIAKNNSIEVEEKTITEEELIDADGVFLTGTAAEITPIKKIKEKEFEIGKEIKLIQKEYEEIIHGKKENYFKWLTFV
jgi:branched-chain amino acid aminotransferase